MQQLWKMQQTKQIKQTRQTNQISQNPTHKLWQIIYQNKHNYNQAKSVKL